MPTPTLDEIIRLSTGIKQTIAKFEEAARALASAGRHEEAQTVETAINILKKSLTRIKVCEDGKVHIVH